MTSITEIACRVATVKGYCVRPSGDVMDGYGREHRVEILDDHLLLNMFDRAGAPLCTNIIDTDVSWTGDGSPQERLKRIFVLGGDRADKDVVRRTCARHKIAEAIDSALPAFERAFPDIGEHLSPRAGHAVRLKPGGRSWFAGTCEDKIGIVSGCGARLYSVFFNPVAHQTVDTGAISCSGGPGTIGAISAKHLRRDGVATVRYWRWKNLDACAHNGVVVSLTVPLWEWDAEAHEAEDG
jgi:hypothetical protein